MMAMCRGTEPHGLETGFWEVVTDELEPRTNGR